MASGLRDPALRAINAALGSGPDRVTNYVFEGHEHCEPLQHGRELLGLLTDSPAFDLAEQLTEPGGLVPVSCCQVATRFPDLGPPWGFPTPHVDGIPNGTNGLRAGTLYPFSVLVGVFLSSVPRPECGNFVVFPGGHQVVADYAREHPDGWFDERGYGPPPMGLPALPLGDPTELTMRAGDVLLSHHLSPHSASRNRSPNIRYAVYYRLGHRAFCRSVASPPRPGGLGPRGVVSSPPMTEDRRDITFGRIVVAPGRPPARSGHEHPLVAPQLGQAKHEPARCMMSPQT